MSSRVSQTPPANPGTRQMFTDASLSNPHSSINPFSSSPRHHRGLITRPANINDIPAMSELDGNVLRLVPAHLAMYSECSLEDYVSFRAGLHRRWLADVKVRNFVAVNEEEKVVGWISWSREGMRIEEKQVKTLPALPPNPHKADSVCADGFLENKKYWKEKALKQWGPHLSELACLPCSFDIQASCD